jgi:hypothetical protein
VALALLVLALALVTGRLVGGRLSALADIPVRDTWWLLVAMAVQVAGSLLSAVAPEAYPGGLIASGLIASRFVWRNLHLTGIPLAGLGLLLNITAVSLNGAMPVSTYASARAGLVYDAPNDPRHITASAGTRLRWLGDVVPFPFPLHREVDSPGDVLLAAGIGLFVFTGMLRVPARRAGRTWEAAGHARAGTYEPSWVGAGHSGTRHQSGPVR